MARTAKPERPELHPEFDDAVREFFDAQTSELLDRYGAVGFGLGYKVKGGIRQDCLSLRLYVQAKTQPRQKPKNGELLDEYLVIDTGNDKLQVCTDVAECPIAVPHTGVFTPTERVHPLVGGAAIGTIDERETDIGVGGTLGGWAWDKKNRCVVLVSNAHALGRFAIGSLVKIKQPSNGDFDLIAELTGSAGFFGDDPNRVDAAVAAMLDMRRVEMTVHEIGPAIMATALPEKEDPVEKYGVATGRTFGFVTNKYWLGHLKTGSGERKLFKSCMRIEKADNSPNWADHGDSGALVFASRTLPGSSVKPVVGLHFAGPEGNANVGYACKITEVYRALDLSSVADGALSVVLAAAGVTEANEEGARNALSALLDGVPCDGATRALHDVMTVHRAEITELIIRDPDDGEVRKSAAGVLQLLVGRGQTLEDVCRATLAEPLTRAIHECCESLARHSKSEEFRVALDSLRTLVATNRDNAVADAVAFEARSLHPMAADQPTEGVTYDDVTSYLEEHGGELLERFKGVAAEPYDHSPTTYGILLTRQPGVASALPLPPVVTWNRGGRQVNIPLRDQSGPEAVAA